MNTALVLAYVVVSVVLVILADRSDAHRFDCGCPWPAEEDGPVTVECACGVEYEFRVWRDWRGRQRDAWDEIANREGETNG